MTLTVLASGSKGNCAVLQHENCAVMIDAGIAAANITAKLLVAKIDPKRLDGIILTHEHHDHTCGLARFINRYPCPVFANPLTAVAVSQRAEFSLPPWHCFENRKPFVVGNLLIEAFPVYHDAVDPVGFSIINGDAVQLAFATDLGQIDTGFVDVCAGATTAFIEANYDDRMVELSGRPYSVIERTRGRNGHLSNAQAAEGLCDLKFLRKAILGHLSETTNTPELAQITVSLETGGMLPIEVAFTPQRERHLPAKTFEIL